jgi:hypothetical protein
MSKVFGFTKHAGRLLGISNLLLEGKDYTLSIKPQLHLQFIYSS